MAYLIRVGENPTYWSGNPESVFVDQAAEAKEYSTKKEAEKELKEIAESHGYSTLNVVKSEDAPSAELPVVETEEVSEETLVEESPLSVEDLRKLAS
jgi:arsenate reductase-like glutaredoxin family protein